MLYDSFNPLVILVIILGLLAVLSIIAFSIYRYLHPKLKDEEKQSEEELAEEELSRILQPIENEETAKQVEEYVDKEDQPSK